ncbi:hypothetical protein T02_2302 [Trichinella nativa]|uniref:Uncharacterized protein n=1 Tax=Trichinella nativa TaxID=6335 RepID=A0A0V1L3C3_9BILA|nr:hypothetical protein T02_2302 [Trichinella nativa]
MHSISRAQSQQPVRQEQIAIKSDKTYYIYKFTENHFYCLLKLLPKISNTVVLNMIILTSHSFGNDLFT